MSATGPNIVEISDGTFDQEVLASEQPFLLDLGAPWCQPCKVLEPLVVELSNEYAGKIRFGTMNIDDNQQTPTKFQVRSVPTLLLFAKGEVVGQLMGSQPRKRIVELLDKAL